MSPKSDRNSMEYSRGKGEVVDMILLSKFAKLLPSLVPPIISIFFFMKQIPWLNIIGINSSDITILPKNLLKSIKDADIVFGAKRHTSLFQNLNEY